MDGLADYPRRGGPSVFTLIGLGMLAALVLILAIPPLVWLAQTVVEPWLRRP